MKQSKFDNLPITSKLRRLQAVSVGLALLFTLVFNGVTQLWHSHGEMIVDVDSTASMIGYNADAALLFNDSKSATDILSSLRGKPSIIAAQIYSLEGLPFANYKADHYTGTLPETLAAAKQILQDNGKVALTYIRIQPIYQDAEQLGYLYLMIDLQPMWWSIASNLGQISLVMLGAFLLSVLYGQSMAALISIPLIRLSLLARQVSQENNYTLRATGVGEDEIGQLVKSFNQMIEKVQQRDAELESHRNQLEHEVEVRTADLRHAVQEAKAASIAKSQFLATMSHEIRTPMNGVLGMTELLLGTDLTLAQRHYAETAFSSADLLLAIINDILDFSKIEAGKLELEEIDFKLSDLTDHVAALLFERAYSKNIELICDIEPNVPDEVRGDPHRLRQILTNLLANAIKFTEVGVVKLHVSLAASRQDAQADKINIKFLVSDTGIGISPEAMSKLFKSFSQADGSTTRKYGGTGLGLVICKELSELMQGTLTVESNLGVGTRFFLELPLALASAPINNEAHPNTLMLNKRVLVVEDNPTDAKIITSYLANFGMTANVAENGERALELLELTLSKGQAFDIALVDMKMPGMDGIQLCQHIRKDPRFSRMPIIMITSSTFEGELANIHASGCDLYLYKPIRKRHLQDAILKLLTAQPNRREIPPQLQNLRVLLAEDNPVNQEIGLAMLNVLGCQVQVAVNGLEAVNIFKQGGIDFILMDCMMPEMDGYTAASTIRKLEETTGDRRIPILALTANAMQGDKERCLAAGMSDHLAKPYLQQALSDKMTALLDDKTIISTTAPQVTSQEIGPAHFDPASLNTLQQMGGDALVARLLGLFRSSAAQEIATIQAALLAHDTAAIHLAAHSLKSAATHVGGLYLADLARALEHEARDGAVSFDSQRAEALKIEFDAVLHHISQYEAS